jgi:hypothetical protein
MVVKIWRLTINFIEAAQVAHQAGTEARAGCRESQ